MKESNRLSTNYCKGVRACRGRCYDKTDYECHICRIQGRIVDRTKMHLNRGAENHA